MSCMLTTSCTKFEILKFQMLIFQNSKCPDTPHASEEQGKEDKGERRISRRDRKILSDLNSFVKMSAGLQVPEI
jgi:hypothetical protein